MIFEERFLVGIQDTDKNNLLTNKALLEYMGNVACLHSNYAGTGPKQIAQTHLSWMTVNWKVDVKNRPEYFQHFIVKTWSRGYDRLYAYRDFEIIDDTGEQIAIATSRWALVDISKHKINSLNSEIMDKYETETRQVFQNYDFPKAKELESFIKEENYKINSMMIDFNNHVHNTSYLDLADEIIPEEYLKNQFNNFEIIYKKEIKLDANVLLKFSEVDDKKYVTIKSEDNTVLHSQIIFN